MGNYVPHPTTHLIGDVNGDGIVDVNDGWNVNQLNEILELIGATSSNPDEDKAKVKFPRPVPKVHPYSGKLGDVDGDGEVNEDDGWTAEELVEIRKRQAVLDAEANRYVNQRGFINRVHYNWSPPIPKEVTRDIYRKISDSDFKTGDKYYSVHALFPKTTPDEVLEKYIYKFKRLYVRAVKQGDPTGENKYRSLYMDHILKKRTTLNKVLRQMKGIGLRNIRIKIRTY